MYQVLADSLDIAGWRELQLDLCDDTYEAHTACKSLALRAVPVSDVNLARCIDPGELQGNVTLVATIQQHMGSAATMQQPGWL